MNENLPANQPNAPEESAEPKLRLRFEICPQGIGNLFGALAKAQGKFKPVLKTSSNPFFKSKYADLAEVINATRDALAEHDIAVTQPPCFRREDGLVEVHTFMAHKSGEWIHSILEMVPTKTDPQGLGSCITYGRRYAFSGIVNVSSEFDDDGNEASGKHERTEAEEKQYAQDFDQRTQDQQCIPPFQQNAVKSSMKATGKTDEDLATYLKLAGYKRLEDVLRSDFDKLIKWANASAPKAKPAAKPATKPGEHNWPALFAKGRAKGYFEPDIKDWYKKHFGVESGTQLTSAQFAELMEKVESWMELTPP